MKFALKALFFVVVFMMVANTTVFAEPIEEGGASYSKQDYKTTIELWQPLAKQGEQWAQVCVGLMYLEGQGVERDYEEAYFWFLIASKASFDFSHNIELRDYAAKNLTPDQKTRVDRRALTWEPTVPEVPAKDNTDPFAAFRVTIMMFEKNKKILDEVHAEFLRSSSELEKTE